jgi:XTP/dITP diphosphohydrolase
MSRHDSDKPIRELVLATHNPGKVREIAELMAPHAVSVLSAGALGLPEPEETGTTFEENALIKAVASAIHSGRPALSDDSGLVVPALGGDPGIYSARWAGPGKDFDMAMGLVWEKLRERGAEANAEAYFVCVLALCWPDGTTETYEGRVDGHLIFPPRGANGFGYDPMFIPDGYDQTFGEMDPAAKHAMSHRAIAFRKLVARHFGARG